MSVNLKPAPHAPSLKAKGGPPSPSPSGHQPLKGTIPLNLLLHDTTTISNVAGSSSMFLEDDKVIDHPMRLNFDPKKLIDGENLEVKDIFCGASGTAFTTPNGKCYVISSIKNGELGISAKEALTLQLLDVPSVANVSLGQNVSAVLTKEGEISPLWLRRISIKSNGNARSWFHGCSSQTNTGAISD